MQYPPFDFTKNGLPTMFAIQPGIDLIPPKLKTDEQIISSGDLMALKVLYKCQI
jgi:hypothetical protein